MDVKILQPYGYKISVEKGGFEELVKPWKQGFLQTRYLLIGVIITILFCAGVAVAVTQLNFMNDPNHHESKLEDISISWKERDVHVSGGSGSVHWEAEVTQVTPSQELKLVWYGPDCKEIRAADKPRKYKVVTTTQDDGRTTATLTLYNATEQDVGIYKLRVITESNEQWSSFSLTVGRSGRQEGHVVICYLAGWAHLRVGFAKFTVDNIDPDQCTHLIYAFAQLNITTNIVYSMYPDSELDDGNKTGMYRRVTNLKQKHPHLKVLLGVGGWTEREHNNYSVMASSPVRRKEFIKSVSRLLREYNFDGLDMHWQYPGEQNGVPSDRKNFVFLLKELKEEFRKQRRGWLLTAPLGVTPLTIQRSYIIPEISKHLDYMLALCYAYHGHWEGHTGPNAGLYGPEEDELNVNHSISMLIALGAPPEKLVLGVPLYGRTFILLNAEDSDKFGGLTTGHGFSGRYVSEPDTWGYNEICLELEVTNWVRHWDNVSHTPFITTGQRFMSYDDPKSIAEKVNYVVSRNMAGVSVWSLDQDDFLGNCAPDGDSDYRYPLMTAINRAFISATLRTQSHCST